MAEELKCHLDVLLLAAIEDGQRHGYAVMEALRHSTRGRLDLPTATIYPALHRLEHAGLIKGPWWPVALAVVLSAGRSGFVLQNVHHALTG